MTDNGSKIKKPPFLPLWLKTMRVPFLQATFIPVVLGSVIAWQAGHFSWGFFALTLLFYSHTPKDE